MMDKLEWEKVAPLAEKLFQFWQDSKGELDWARRSWAMLTAVGLTFQESEVERLRVELRLLVLVALYHHFYCAMEGSREDPEYGWWLDDLEADPFALGRLAERDALPGGDEDVSQAELGRSLVEARHKEVVEALVEGYGGWGALFQSLLESHDDWVDGFVEPQATAYQWVVEERCRI